MVPDLINQWALTHQVDAGIALMAAGSLSKAVVKIGKLIFDRRFKGKSGKHRRR